MQSLQNDLVKISYYGYPVGRHRAKYTQIWLILLKYVQTGELFVFTVSTYHIFLLLVVIRYNLKVSHCQHIFKILENLFL